MTLLLIETLLKDQPIDPKRIYITGLSMGGYGTWDLMARGPELFAAAAPVCGGADEATAEKIKHIPVWAFHGAKDTAVKPQRSRNMIEALKKAGAVQSTRSMPTWAMIPGIRHIRIPSFTSGCLLNRSSSAVSWRASRRRRDVCIWTNTVVLTPRRSAKFSTGTQ